MNQQVISVIPPAPVREPRGAQMAAIAATWMQRGMRALASAGRSVWRALEEDGRRRAARELSHRGISLATLEAAKVRALADRHERTDPRFAADLRAAAARHEMLHGMV